MRWLSGLSPSLLAMCFATAPAGAADLAAHRANYTLVFDSAKAGNVQNAKGTMSYEVQDVCDGWAVQQKLQISLTNGEGQNINTESDYVTWESKDGTHFRFRMKQMTETATTSQTEGEATAPGEGGGKAKGSVHYTLPEDRTMELPPGTLLPMAHTNAIIEGARAGKKFLGLPLFDGTGDKGAQDTNITVLDWKRAGAEGGQFPDLLKLPSTHVHVAFFDRKADATTPDYEVGMRYWENGVGDTMRMDFGEFVMKASMTELTLLPHRC